MIPGPDGSARLQRRIVEIDTLDEFDAIAGVTGAARMDGWRVRRVDLTGRADLLQEFDPAGALFLACDMTPDSLVYLEAGGALVFPDIPGAPVDEYRASLYTADELYGGVRDSGYQATLDAQIYAWSQQRTVTRPRSWCGRFTMPASTPPSTSLSRRRRSRSSG